MADYDADDKDFDSEQVKNLAEKAMKQLVDGQDAVVYQREKVNQWCQQIIDFLIKELAKLDKPFKYAVTCIIQERNGSGIQTAATAFWQSDTDGLISVQMNPPTFICIVTVFALAI